jgi:hypothetical protein
MHAQRMSLKRSAKHIIGGVRVVAGRYDVFLVVGHHRGQQCLHIGNSQLRTPGSANATTND